MKKLTYILGACSLATAVALPCVLCSSRSVTSVHAEDVPEIPEEITPGEDYTHLEVFKNMDISSLSMTAVQFSADTSEQYQTYVLPHYNSLYEESFENYFDGLNTSIQELYDGGSSTSDILDTYRETGAWGEWANVGVKGNLETDKIQTKADGTEKALAYRTQTYYVAGTTTDPDSKTPMNNTSNRIYYATDNMTARTDYSAHDLWLRDYYGITYTNCMRLDLNAYSTATTGIHRYNFQMTFRQGFTFYDYSPLMLGDEYVQVWFLMENGLTNQLEWVSNDVYGTGNRCHSTLPAFPGGADRVPANADYDGSMYKMHNNAYAGKKCYKMVFLYRYLPDYLCYNSFATYAMHEYSAYDLGYNTSANVGAGYSQGYVDGYNAGSSTGTSPEANVLTGPFALIGSAFNAVASVLNISVFGAITLGTLVFIPLIIFVVIAIIKLIKG